MHLPEIDKYAHLDSPIHRWDARARILSVTALLLVTVFLPTVPLAVAALGAALVLLGLTRIPISFVFAHLKWVLMFCLFLIAVMGLTAGGPAIWSAGPLQVSARGLARAGLISVRAVTAVLLIYPMMGTARVHVSLKALQGLGVPQVAVQILSFSYRYTFVLFDELGRMLTAARARGLSRARGLRAFENFGSMVGMLFVRSFDRTERVYNAMLARGYQGRAESLHEFHFAPADAAKAALVLAAAASLATAGILI